MDEVMAITLRSMQHDVSRLERVASNLANALTPGYRREVMVQRSESLGGAGTSFAKALQHEAGEQASTGSTMATVQVLRDPRVGTLKATAQPLDVAIAGRGFFEVATPQGPAYTRQGQFQVDPHGRLVTQQGHAVIGQSGEITLAPGPVAIDGLGNVSQSGRAVGRIKLVDFEDSSRLQAGADGFFASGAHARTVEDQDVQLRQGFLENANISSMHEMVELMRTMRHFESMHRALQSYDEMLGSAVRKLGDMS
jgi:flagellar basal-body rod protein FlgF